MYTRQGEYPGSTVFNGVPKTSAVFLMTVVPHHAGKSMSGSVNAYDKDFYPQLKWYKENENGANCETDVETGRLEV